MSEIWHFHCYEEFVSIFWRKVCGKLQTSHLVSVLVLTLIVSEIWQFRYYEKWTKVDKKRSLFLQLEEHLWNFCEKLWKICHCHQSVSSNVSYNQIVSEIWHLRWPQGMDKNLFLYLWKIRHFYRHENKKKKTKLDKNSQYKPSYVASWRKWFRLKMKKISVTMPLWSF